MDAALDEIAFDTVTIMDEALDETVLTHVFSSKARFLFHKSYSFFRRQSGPIECFSWPTMTPVRRLILETYVFKIPSEQACAAHALFYLRSSLHSIPLLVDNHSHQQHSCLKAVARALGNFDEHSIITSTSSPCQPFEDHHGVRHPPSEPYNSMQRCTIVTFRRSQTRSW